ncbi:GD17679 [Drosophila simulans]|uniref:GD17679 n=1 Tax=Drosophila simulans TaxID=7240 RepID=B4NST2_DROSI|nr:GD17679 [Drosophila simulans]
MEQLRFRFGRPEQLIRRQLNNVREVQLISKQNLAKIIPFATRVNKLAAVSEGGAAPEKANPHGGASGKSSYKQARGLGQECCSAQLQEYADVVCTV